MLWSSIYKTYPKLNPEDAGLSIAVGATVTVTYFFMPPGQCPNILMVWPQGSQS